MRKGAWLVLILGVVPGACSSSGGKKAEEFKSYEEANAQLVVENEELKERVEAHKGWALRNRGTA